MVNKNVRYYDGSSKTGRKIMAQTGRVFHNVSGATLAERREIDLWNAEVERKKSEKRRAKEPK